MSDKSKIEWTDATWPIVTGCTKVSDGCKHCYAERNWARLSANPKTVYYGRKFTDVQVHPERLEQPLRWRRPRMIFVPSMGDLFHPAVSDGFLLEVFRVMKMAEQHTFQVLTKRAERMLSFCRNLVKAGYGPIPGNIWLGISAEDQETADERIPLLIQAPAAVRFVSLEPLLGPIDLSQYLDICQYEEGGKWGRRNIGRLFDMLDWVIVGGESGPKARPMRPAWVRSLRNQCTAAKVPFFFKQWGEWVDEFHHAAEGLTPGPGPRFSEVFADYKYGPEGQKIDYIGVFMYSVGKKAAGCLLDGREWKEYPAKNV